MDKRILIAWALFALLLAFPASADIGFKKLGQTLVDFILAATNATALILFGLGFLSMRKGEADPANFGPGATFWRIFTAVLLSGISSVYILFKQTLIEPNWKASTSSAFRLSDALVKTSDRGMGRFTSGIGENLQIAFFLFGLYTLIKGIWMLRQLGVVNSMSQQQVSGAGALTHIVFGVAMMNMVRVSCGLLDLFGFTFVCHN